MRRREKQITDIAAIEEILARADVCRIAMCDDGIPYIVPVNFGYENRALFIHSARDGRKIDILGRNNRVCFEVDTGFELVTGMAPCDWGARYVSVIGSGRAEFITGTTDKKRALNAIMRKYSGESGFEYDDTRVDGVALIRIDIEEMTGKKSGIE